MLGSWCFLFPHYQSETSNKYDTLHWKKKKKRLNPDCWGGHSLGGIALDTVLSNWWSHDDTYWRQWDVFIFHLCDWCQNIIPKWWLPHQEYDEIQYSRLNSQVMRVKDLGITSVVSSVPFLGHWGHSHPRLISQLRKLKFFLDLVFNDSTVITILL